jgi:hypothetical protein
MRAWSDGPARLARARVRLFRRCGDSPVRSFRPAPLPIVAAIATRWLFFNLAVLEFEIDQSGPPPIDL